MKGAEFLTHFSEFKKRNRSKLTFFVVGGGVLLHLRHKELEQRRGEQGRGKREGEGGGGRATKRESVCVSP